MINAILMDMAKKSINQKFDSSIIIDTKYLFSKYPSLEKDGACFVTLTLDGQLRGCIGTLYATRSILEDVISNAYGAAFNDPRFYELTKQEFEKINIEISILSEPKKLNYLNLEDLEANIKVNHHGLILQKGNKRATFLPQVWEQLDNFELFFSHLCQKAGLNKDCLNSNPEIFTYTVEKIK